MTWTDTLTSAALAVIAAVLPYVAVLARQWVAAHIKDARLKQLATGVTAAAGRAYLGVIQAHEKQPGAPLASLVGAAVMAEAQRTFAAYKETAAALGATPVDVETRIAGALGNALAADPTVTVAPQPAPQAAPALRPV